MSSDDHDKFKSPTKFAPAALQNLTLKFARARDNALQAA